MLSFHEFIAKFYQENNDAKQNLDYIFENQDVFESRRLLFQQNSEV